MLRLGHPAPLLLSSPPPPAGHCPPGGRHGTSISVINGGYSLLFSLLVYFLKLPGKKRNDGADKHTNKQTTALWMELCSEG